MLKCASYNCNSIRNNAEIVKSLLDSFDIVFIQELMLNKSDLSLLNDFHEDFRHIAFVKDREAEGINEGRPSRGVAIFWRQDLSSIISPVFIDDSIIGIVLIIDNVKYLFLNVYLPYDQRNSQSLDRYRNALALLQVIVEEQGISNVFILGDFNADPHKGRFWRELLQFCTSLSLSHLNDRLPSDSFTYLCPAKSTTSLLDHILCSHHVSQFISEIYVDYSNALFDHFPLCFNISMEVKSMIVHKQTKSPGQYVKWNKIAESDKMYITKDINRMILERGILHCEALSCCNLGCQNHCHLQSIEKTFSDLKMILRESTAEFCFSERPRFKIIPGWNDEVKQFHTIARRSFLLWKDRGKPLNGPIHDEMKLSRSIFRSALDNCKSNEKLIRREKLLKNFGMK